MQHTNDDIDELFRNAADNYPLKINGADWESVAGRLQDGQGDDGPAAVIALRSKGSKKNYRYLLLLLLLPIGFFAGKYASRTKDSGNGLTTEANNSNKVTAPGAAQQNAAALNDKNSSELSDKSNKILPGNLVNTSTAKQLSNASVAATRGKVKGLAINQAAVVAQNSKTSATGSFIPPLSQLGNSRQQHNEQPVNNNPAANSIVKPLIEKNDVTNNDLQAGHSVAKSPENPNIEPAVGNKKEPGVDPPVHIPKQKRFYIGAFIAPDYTTVKYQPGNKIGFDYGGLVGYNFAKSLSVEFGISTDKKYYTTDGKYYNSKQQWLANSGKLLTLSGYSSLTEFPLNVKYNFKPGRDGNFFASAGLVSYVVHEENYDYEFDKSGFIYHKVRSSKLSTTNIFANINLSAGYESALSNSLYFRVEPYYRIPVQGIGLGSLPITSIGLNIGITKKIR